MDVKTRIFLLLTLVLLASGCISGDSESDESFQGLLNSSENSSFGVSYSVSGPAIEDGIVIDIYRSNDLRHLKAVRETPGGTVISEVYELENNTVSCYTSPSPGGGTEVCTVGYRDGIYNFLNTDKWNVTGVNRSGTENISERACKAFSTDIKVRGQSLRLEEVFDADICLDQEKGYVSAMNISSEERLVDFRVQNYTEKVPEDRLTLDRVVEVVTHCTDSRDVEITPMRQLEEAVLSVNGENRTVSLPEKFETEFYQLPERDLKTGENTIAVYTEEGSLTRTCYRRPN